jgi:phosphatidylinositol alpha-1,6-mannosyltransferase
VKEERIHIVFPPVECDRFTKPYSQEEIKHELGLKGRHVILYVGRLTRRKGAKEFLEASFPLIRERVADAFFLIVGGDPKGSLVHRDHLVQELAYEIKRSGNQNHVRILESLTDEDLIKAYLACDLLILPVLPMVDDVEGFGIVIMEAAAAGRPSVATKVGGVTEAIEDGKSGLLVDPLDIKGLAEAVITLLQDEKKRLAMGEYGKKRARESYDCGVVAQQYEKLLLDL